MKEKTVSVQIDGWMAKELDFIQDAETKSARDRFLPDDPKLSSILRMLLSRGIKSWKADNQPTPTKSKGG